MTWEPDDTTVIHVEDDPVTCELCGDDYREVVWIEMAAPPFGQTFPVCERCAEKPIIELVEHLRRTP